jgi:ribonuclease PH
VRVGRAPDALRAITLERHAAPNAEGSCLVSFGRTRVLCTVSVEDGVPGWRRGRGEGWLTAEYAMLPRATSTRTSRERGQIGGRTQEIQRLIGRSLRAVTDLVALGENQIVVDCDVLQADGGTRTASICGGWIALHDACSRLLQRDLIARHPIREACAAISVGVVGSVPMLDLEYTEDVRAEVDMNVVMTESARFVEVQGTAEGMAFTRDELSALLELAESGIAEIVEAQVQMIAVAPAPRV